MSVVASSLKATTPTLHRRLRMYAGISTIVELKEHVGNAPTSRQKAAMPNAAELVAHKIAFAIPIHPLRPKLVS
jgi:hypothetical protein